jgi:AMP-binding enzyme
MILGSPQHQKTAGAGGRITLDDLFGAALAQRPDQAALIDPPHREAFTAGAPRRLTYAQADRAITAIAARLGRDGLARGEVVALQMPNTVEAVLALLGVLRAGLIASPLPLLWRRADCTAAIAAAGARALITMGRVGATDHGALAAAVAAQSPTIEHVYVFGGAGDGATSLDDVLAPDADTTSATANPAPTEPDPAAGSHVAANVAVVTWEVTPAGLMPVARSHAEVVMAGLEPMLEGRFEPTATIVSSLCLGSAAALAATLVPWLLSHATLALHHPFAPLAMRQQILDLGCHTAIVPGSLAARAAEASMFADSEVRQVIALWRNPERLAACPPWQPAWPGLVDVVAFGEAGLMAVSRSADGRPAGLIPGPTRRTADTGPLLIEAACTREGTLALRGPMVPRLPFPPGAAPGMPVDADGFLDTFYPCRAASGSGALTVTGPPVGVVSMGGYRFILAGLQDAVSQIEPGAMLAAFPDALAGQRVAGIAVRRHSIRDALAKLGFNPLVINAFRARRGGDARDAA